MDGDTPGGETMSIGSLVRIGRGAALPAVALVFWWVSTDVLHLFSPLVLPGPKAVLAALWTVISQGYRDFPLTFHLWSSLRRLALGFGLALALGAPLGLWLGRNAAARAVAYPAIEIVRPLPPLGYYAIIVLWFGIYETSKVVLLFLAALAPVVLSTIDAAAQTPNHWVQAARSMGMSTGQLYRHVLLPAALPGIFTGMRVGLGFAFSTLVAAEMVAADAGVGWIVLDAGRYLRHDMIFVGNLVLAATALCLDRCVLALRRRLVPWAFDRPYQND